MYNLATAIYNFLDKPLREETKDEDYNYRLESANRDIVAHQLYQDKMFEMGITNDLSYNRTLDKCDDKQHIKIFLVDGYTTIVNWYNEKHIDHNKGNKINKLLQDNKIGWLDCCSDGCLLCCRPEDYKWICRHLKIPYDTDDDIKCCHYGSMFDDIRLSLEECCSVIETITKGMTEKQYDDFRKTLYDVARYVIVNIERYKDILLSAREYNEDTKDEHWVNRLWIVAYNDMKGGK